ncbi:MAG: ABC transporter permease subunit [Solobacterium sp.]|nr:ABC transporter permease subunit [Solobacterium sp.]
MTTLKVEGKKNRRSPRKVAVNVLVHVFLAVLAAIWVLPIFWIILTSFREEPGSYVSTFFPKGYTLNNYVKLFTDRNILNFPKMFTNTLIIAIFTCIISTFFVMSVGYSLSRMRFKFRKPYMNLAMVLGLFPGFMAMIAQYYLLKAMGLTEGGLIRLALIIAYTASTGLGFQIVKGYFDTIPHSIDEAAIIDGASQWQVFTKITLPLAKPILIYTLLTSFMAPWVDFIFAKVICRATASQYTVAIGLWNMLQKEYITQWYTCFAAGAVVVSIPISILFLFTQKYYVDGMSGAVKG